MSARARLLGLAQGRSAVLVHGGAVLVVALALAAESADEPLATVGQRLAADLPHTWALLAPALTVASTALAVTRLRATGQVTALGSVGVGLGALSRSGLWSGVLVGSACLLVGVSVAPALEVARVAGGWWLRGEFVPDAVGTVPVLPPGVTARWWATGGLCVLGGWVGAVLGTWAGAGSVLVAAGLVLCFDLVQRGLPVDWAFPLGALAVAGAMLVRAAAPGGRRWPAYSGR